MSENNANNAKMQLLLEYLREILNCFRPAFSRNAAFENFKLAVIGFLIADETTAVTDLVRYFDYNDDLDRLYEKLIKFFHASSYSIQSLQEIWLDVIGELTCSVKIGKFSLLAGDGVKVMKSGRHMAAVKKMYQESESVAKPAYIWGHMYGSTGIIIGNGDAKSFCLPIETAIQDGNSLIETWRNPSYTSDSHVVQMMASAGKCLKTVRSCILAMDRYFLTIPAVRALATTNALKEHVQQELSMILVTKTRRNGIAFEPPPLEKNSHKRGRKRKKGASVKLYELFEQKKDEFVKTKIHIYGKEQEVEYYCIDLLWGLGLYYPMRFVLVKNNGMCSILVSSSDTLTPEQIIRSYAFRWKCEAGFKDAKHTIGTFSSHFWTRSMPRLNRYSRKGSIDPLACIDNEQSKKKIISNYEAFGKFAMVGNIAQGILQLLSLKAHALEYEPTKYLRSRSQQVMSEDSMNYELRKVIKWGIEPFCSEPIPRLITPMLAS